MLIPFEKKFGKSHSDCCVCVCGKGKSTTIKWAPNRYVKHSTPFVLSWCVCNIPNFHNVKIGQYSDDFYLKIKEEKKNLNQRKIYNPIGNVKSNALKVPTHSNNNLKLCIFIKVTTYINYSYDGYSSHA